MKLHAPFTRLALLGALVIGVAGCSNVKPSEDHLKTLSETNLGEPVKRISNVRSDSMQTYYVASTASGDYNCQVPSGASGGMMAVASFGIMKPSALCQAKGAKGGQLAPFMQ
ncbi:hypothetical protein [Pseudomonas mucidolens]|uniref:Lipoprotein n=1 Tax=Pseudomonas mucidolens TaxID=46679 RepID=A0A1H2MHK2_9PSED|nr:hypothetical protein [Pseudomonas mucidolens]SDU92381.1 hypothetical protein SAMN05216202_1690 [Pseudomonas mucidolens]SQH33896.1 lipoprotein [Pseudomonas mucidolens]